MSRRSSAAFAEERSPARDASRLRPLAARFFELGCSETARELTSLATILGLAGWPFGYMERVALVESRRERRSARRCLLERRGPLVTELGRTALADQARAHLDVARWLRSWARGGS